MGGLGDSMKPGGLGAGEKKDSGKKCEVCKEKPALIATKCNKCEKRVLKCATPACIQVMQHEGCGGILVLDPKGV